MGDSFAPLVVQPPYFRFIERQVEKPVIAAIELLLRMTIKCIKPGGVSVNGMRRVTATLDTWLDRVDKAVTLTPQQCDQVPAEWLDVPGSRAERVILYLHGGTFAFRLPRMQTALIGHWCRALGARALMPRYRLAPEYPFPAGTGSPPIAGCSTVAATPVGS